MSLEDYEVYHQKGGEYIIPIEVFEDLYNQIIISKEENESLKKQLHEASLNMQEMTERDIECPSNCEKLRKLTKQN